MLLYESVVLCQAVLQIDNYKNGCKVMDLVLEQRSRTFEAITGSPFAGQPIPAIGGYKEILLRVF